MKRCSISYVFREMQLKTKMSYHYIPFGMAQTQNAGNTKWWRKCGATGTLILCWWESETVQQLRQTVWQFLTKLNILLPYNLAIILLGIYPKKLKIYVHTKAYTVYSDFIHNCQNLEATKMSFSR